MFCQWQNARGAICAHSLASELADSFRLIMKGLKMKNMTIRLETEKDYRAVEELTREAFWNVYKPGADEHYFVHTMRSHPDFIPELAFVLELDL